MNELEYERNKRGFAHKGPKNGFFFTFSAEKEGKWKVYDVTRNSLRGDTPSLPIQVAHCAAKPGKYGWLSGTICLSRQPGAYRPD